MEKRDYLMDQIEQLGQALATILSKLYGHSSQDKVPEVIEMTSQSLKTELDLDLSEISSIPDEQFITSLQREKKFNYANMELLADILLLVAEENSIAQPESDEKQNLCTKCLIIYNYLNENDLTYSFERQSKISRIESIL